MESIGKTISVSFLIFLVFIGIALLWIFTGVFGVLLAKIIEGIWFALDKFTILCLGVLAWFIRLEIKTRGKK